MDSTGEIAQIVGWGFGAIRVAALRRRRDPGWVTCREKITGDSSSLWEARIDWNSAYLYSRVYRYIYIERSQVYLLTLDKYNYLDRTDLSLSTNFG
jgi:hypothetical protein